MNKEQEAALEWVRDHEDNEKYYELSTVFLEDDFAKDCFLAGIAWERHRAAKERIGMEEEKE